MKEKSCDNCYWKTGDSCTYSNYPNDKNVCDEHHYFCNKCEEQAEFIINDKVYCGECAVKENGIQIEDETIYYYTFNGGDHIGTSLDMSIDEVLDFANIKYKEI